MSANPNMWAFAVSSSVSVVVMAVLWEVLSATPSPDLMQQTATSTEGLRIGMRDRSWMNLWLREYAYECFSGSWDIVCCDYWGMCPSYINSDLIMWSSLLRWGSLGSLERMGEDRQKREMKPHILFLWNTNHQWLLLKFFISISSLFNFT